MGDKHNPKMAPENATVLKKQNKNVLQSYFEFIPLRTQGGFYTRKSINQFVPLTDLKRYRKSILCDSALRLTCRSQLPFYTLRSPEGTV